MTRAARACVVALVAATAVACGQTPAAAPAVATGGSGAAGAVAGSPSGHGRVEKKLFVSDALGVTKRVVVYLPAGYDAHRTARYPVFYYLHGLTGDETNWVDGGHLDTQADAMGLQAIVVMPDGDDSFYADALAPSDYDACMASGQGLFFPERERKWTCVRTPRYETYITKDLVGWVDSTYRTIATRQGRAIAGLSMGGFGALMLAMRHPDEFAAAASHSGIDALLYAGPHPYVAGHAQLTDSPDAWAKGAGPQIGPWVEGIFGRDITGWREHDPSYLQARLAPGQVALYLDCGTEDDFGLDAGAAYLHDLLTQRSYPHEYFSGPGGHNFEFWAPRLPHSLAFLRDHTAHATN